MTALEGVIDLVKAEDLTTLVLTYGDGPVTLLSGDPDDLDLVRRNDVALSCSAVADGAHGALK